MSLQPWIILLMIALLILAFGVYVLRYRKQHLTGKDIRKVRQHWAKIQDLATLHPEQAIMNADKLLDFALNQAGYTGTLGEKMKAAQAVFRDNDALWSAHKLRNRIAHVVDVRLDRQRTKGALLAYKKAFYDLGITL